MDDVTFRQKLLEAKKEIESKSGIKFSRDTIALADLMSEFVAIKVLAQMPKQEARPDHVGVGKVIAPPKDDLLYG